jgi:gliding motility-associated-like protein
MQRLYTRAILLLFVLLGTVYSAQATHIYGADFFYEHVSGNTYKISLVVYGDCKGASFPNLQGAQPTVFVKNGTTAIATISLNQSGPGVEVTPVCEAQKNNTTCQNPSNPISGVTRYIYTANYTLPYTSANWVFRFDGNMPVPGGVNGAAGRSTQITNLPGSGSSVTALEARLNNLTGGNSSPQFTTLPTPFYCANVPQLYNLGASDINSDSLTFALTPGLQSGGGVVSYLPGFSGTNPLWIVPGTFSFSSTTGQMNFTLAGVQWSLVVQTVEEYRNGVLVGTSSREMTFIVLANCNSRPATNAIDTAGATPGKLGGVIVGNTDFNVCLGIDSAKFAIVASNPGNNTIRATIIGLPAGATATVTNDSTTSPVINFLWKNPAMAPGNYTFFVTYKDDGCPLSSIQTQAYTLHVYKPNDMGTKILAPTECAHKAFVDFNFFNGLAPRTVNVTQGGNTILNFRDSTGNRNDSLAAGTYTVTINSDKLVCPTVLQLIVPDSGVYPYPPKITSPVFYCKYATSVSLGAIGDSGAIVRWYMPNGNLLNAAPTPRTDTTGIFTWLVDQRYKVCVSPKDSIKVFVTLRPIAKFDAPTEICQNDTATILFTGSVGEGPILEYHWDFDSAGYKVGEGPGPWRVHWYDSGMKVIKLRVDENKCPSLPIEQKLWVKPIPYAGFTVSDVCQYDTVSVYYSTTPLDGQKYAWVFEGADKATATGPGPYVLSWQDSGRKHLSLTVEYNGCVDTRTRELMVYPAPDAKILNDPATVCIGDKLQLYGTGGVSYMWTRNDTLLKDIETPNLNFQIIKPERFMLYVKSEYGCRDSAAIAFYDIQPCCNFSYPNAFTPNNDGRNDIFHVITYGNQLEYELSIYNRWGQRVYYGHDPKQGWNGMYNGKVCDAGTYFYYLAAKCFTGRAETQKGELMLIR